jgi:hypothetical protein
MWHNTEIEVSSNSVNIYTESVFNYFSTNIICYDDNDDSDDD